MKKKRSLCAALLAGLMVTAVCLTGCGKKADDNAGGGSSDPDKVYQVGVCQLTQHDALDAATQGFVDALNTILGSEHVNIDVQVASGDSTTCTPIVNSFVNKKVDLIMANATPALQAAYNATTSIPILGTSVTEYGVALGLSDFSGTVGGNISGTSDLAPLTEQADMILELVPQAKTVGLLYCSAEPNSEYQVKVVEDYLSGKGITCTETIGSIVRSAKTPVVAGEQGICVGCGIATLSISYYDLGYKTGEMAAQILKGEADISQMPIEYANASKLYNADMCQELGITVPEGYTALEG